MLGRTRERDMSTVGVVTGAGRGMGLACARRLAGTVDTMLLVDQDEPTVTAAARELPGAEPFGLDITDPEGLARLATRVSALGTLRSVAHAAGISPTMAGWRRIITVDLVGTARLVDALRPLVIEGTALVCFASMAPMLGPFDPGPEVLDDPLRADFTDRLRTAIGPSIEDTGVAYSLAKLGVHRFVRREAVRLGRAGARICSVSPGLIDTPQGRQEAGQHGSMAELARRTPLGRQGRADEVAAVVAFALSDEATFLTGIDLLVDGGLVAAVTTR
jgi:NAD(P)-dependent dehydrogenase (short-subunit alcohol dehydrogenase family)